MAAVLLFLGPLLELFGKIPGAIFNLPFGNIFGAIGKFFSDLFNSIIHHPLPWIMGILVVTNAFTFWEWRHTDAALIKERAAYAAQAANFKNAQAVANAQAIAERNVLEKESKANADQADANYASLLAKFHTSLLRYSTSQGGPSPSSNSQLPTPQGSNGPSSNPDLPATLTISGSDAEICAVNTARLVAVHDWAVNLPKQVN